VYEFLDKSGVRRDSKEDFKKDSKENSTEEFKEESKEESNTEEEDFNTNKEEFNIEEGELHNIELARLSGDKLTQAIDADGNLVGVNIINFDDREVSDTAGREAHEKELILNANASFEKYVVCVGSETVLNFWHIQLRLFDGSFIFPPSANSDSNNNSTIGNSYNSGNESNDLTCSLNKANQKCYQLAPIRVQTNHTAWITALTQNCNRNPNSNPNPTSKQNSSKKPLVEESSDDEEGIIVEKRKKNKCKPKRIIVEDLSSKSLQSSQIDRTKPIHILLTGDAIYVYINIYV
jgi:hypothetical protein